MHYLWPSLAVALLTGLGATSARAELEICNDTPFSQTVSIGYPGPEGLTSEGWWRIEPQDCAVLIKGDLQEQHYYYQAASQEGGASPGGNFAFCTQNEAYTIVGTGKCEARGYDSADFGVIDTGPTALDFTFTLRDPSRGNDGGGLAFCNETGSLQSVSVGYREGEGWASRGWWNIEPGDCQATISKELSNRYYYYRAEGGGREFDGEGYTFCTTPEPYTIVGDTDCEERGYETDDFAEIDIGQGVTAYTVTLVGRDPAPTPPGGGGDTGKQTPDTKGGEFPTFERKGAPRPGE